MDTMKIFTIRDFGKVEEGAEVRTFALKGADVKIPAILVGESGRGRELGVLPVQLLSDKYAEWQEKDKTWVSYGFLSTTKTGRPKLISTESANTADKIIVVFRTPIGFRGSNNHTGDLEEIFWRLDPFYVDKAESQGIPRKEKYTEEEVKQYGKSWMFQKCQKYALFPGQVIVKGQIAQGDAGRMGSGNQLVAVVPKDKVFCTKYSGRLYGKPDAHFYKWDGERLLVATWEERQITELF